MPMPLRKLTIHKFRGLHDQEFNFQGKKLNAIIGQNAAMKTTVLGIIASSFAIRSSAMKDEKMLDNKSFGIKLEDRFKFSQIFDPAGAHEWTLTAAPQISSDPYRMKSYRRPNGTLRFWKYGDRKKGVTLIQCPVIYLSMNRLFPLGEDNEVSVENTELTDEERQLFKKWHNSILVSTDTILGSSLVTSSKKSTIAPETKYYDELAISAGQDNVGKIILAVLSMKRLKDKYPQDYRGSIICIDELESTLYPASQVKMLEFLKCVSEQYQIQFFFTTHSMTVIRVIFEDKMKPFVSFTYAKKIGPEVKIHQDVSIDEIENDLYIKSGDEKVSEKVHVYCEDTIGMEFTKYLVEAKYSQKKHLSYENRNEANLGCTSYLFLLKHKIMEFMQSVIVLDGDVKTSNNYAEFKKYPNVVFLPTNDYPEKRVYDTLYGLEDTDSFWSQEVGGYSKQACFKDYLSQDMDQAKIKNWFKNQKGKNGRGYKKIIKKSFECHEDEMNKFLDDFSKAYDYVNHMRV